MSGLGDRVRRALREREASDYLSPILVKEARQGVRGSAFTGAFLLLQGLMVLSLLVSVFAARGAPDQAAAMLFWTSIALPAMVVLPLSGLSALSSERELGTLEPMLLTRLTAQRIVVGKWAALAAQIALLLCAVLPYVLLRYFLGSVELGWELLRVLLLGLSSTLLAAVAVGISASRMSSLFRMLVVLGLAMPIHGAIQGVFEAGAMHGPAVDRGTALAVPLLWALSVQVCLDAGARALAPSAEASSVRSRLLALAALPVAWWVARDGATDAHALLVAWVVVLLLMVVAGGLAEQRREPAVLDAAFFGRGPLRAAAWALLAPGWPSGVLFATLTVSAAAALTVEPSGEPELVAAWGVAVLASLLQPVALTQWLAPRSPRRGALFALILPAAVAASLSGELIVALAPDLPRALPDLCAALSPVVYAVRFSNRWYASGLDPRLPDVVFALVSAASIAVALGTAIHALRARRRELRPGAEPRAEALGDPASA